LAIHGLPDDYSHICDQILGSLVVPTFNFTCSTLLRVPGKSTIEIPSSVTFNDSFASISWRVDHNHTCNLDKDVTSVKIVTSSTTKLIGIMPYMVILLDLLWLPKLAPLQPSD